MLLQTPKEFDRVAREWAVLYAGAPMSNTGNGAAADLDEMQQGAGVENLAK